LKRNVVIAVRLRHAFGLVNHVAHILNERRLRTSAGDAFDAASVQRVHPDTQHRARIGRITCLRRGLAAMP